MFQPKFYNGCHDLIMMYIDLNMKGFGYSFIICGISKSEAIMLMQNTDFTEKSKILQSIKTHYLL